MGFRNGAYATVWSVESDTPTRTKGRISVSRKNKTSGEYETDFSGFVEFIGTAAATKALQLKERDRIKIGDTDVTSRFNKENGVTYTNYKIFSFDSPSELASGGQYVQRTPAPDEASEFLTVDPSDEEMLPF